MTCGKVYASFLIQDYFKKYRKRKERERKSKKKDKAAALQVRVLFAWRTAFIVFYIKMDRDLISPINIKTLLLKLILH